MFKNKKILIYISFSLILAIAVVFIGDDPRYIIPTSSIPVASHTVVLDAGHGLPDGGAVNSDGVSEEQINLQIVLKLQELLEASNCRVILTRSDENGIYDADAKSKKKSDLRNRVEIINNSNADCLVSIHLNKISSEKYSGWQSFYQKGNEKSITLAKLIQSSLNYSTRY